MTDRYTDENLEKIKKKGTLTEVVRLGEEELYILRMEQTLVMDKKAVVFKCYIPRLSEFAYATTNYYLKDNGDAVMETLNVDKKWQNKSVGKLMLQQVVRECAENKCPTLSALVSINEEYTEERMKRFFVRQGFKIMPRSKDSFTVVLQF